MGIGSSPEGGLKSAGAKQGWLRTHGMDIRDGQLSRLWMREARRSQYCYYNLIIFNIYK